MPRKTPHAQVYTANRFNQKSLFWFPVRDALRRHLAASPEGEAARMAKTIGIANSQIHRFACDDCEHDQEPKFSIGAAVVVYLLALRVSPVIDITDPTVWIRKNQFTSPKRKPKSHYAKTGPIPKPKPKRTPVWKVKNPGGYDFYRDAP